MKKWLIILVSAIPFFVQAQEQKELQLINSQVWIPFIEAYNSFHTKHFMALHTEDVIRVSRAHNQIMVGTDYRKSQFRGNSISRSKDMQREIELRFLDRLVNGSIAYEVGYYKVAIKSPENEEKIFYGLFHVTLKKLEGEWKIYIDSDENLPELTEDEFNSAKRLCDY